jgi:acyl-CoA thioesterase-1
MIQAANQAPLRSCILRFYIPMLVFMVMMGVSLGGCKSTPKQKPLPPEARVLAFGDSLTFGAGVLPEQTYPVVLQTLINREVVNGGQPGETTAEGLKRLPIWLKEHEPRLLVLCLGANDMLRSLNEEKAADNLRAMVKLARDRDIDVLLVAVPKYGLMRQPPEFYEQIAREFDIPIEKHALFDIGSDSSLMSDSVHPNAEGYHLLAESIAKRLRKSGAI